MKPVSEKNNQKTYSLQVLSMEWNVYLLALAKE
jgi:hypothetical protein